MPSTIRYVYLTDNSTAAATMMQGLTPAATAVRVFAHHTLWIHDGANPFEGKGNEPTSTIYASLLLPNPL